MPINNWKTGISSILFWIVLSGSAVGGLFGPTDKKPPIINFAGDAVPPVVFMEKIIITGDVEDENTIVSLLINQVPIPGEKQNRIFFSHMADLHVGNNVLTVEATDSKGNSAVRRLQVERRLPSRIQLSERLSLAVLPFEQEEGAAAFANFQDSLIHELTRRNRFQMVERSRIDMILREQALSRTSLFDRQTASRLGRMASARAVITGSIVNRHGRCFICARMIDNETSAIISTQEITGNLKDPLSGRYLAEALALKFHQDFPLVDGHIIGKAGHNIKVDLGHNRVKPGRRLILFREAPLVDPATGKFAGTEVRILGYARVNQVMQKTAVARVRDEDGEALMLTDRVIVE